MNAGVKMDHGDVVDSDPDVVDEDQIENEAPPKPIAPLTKPGACASGIVDLYATVACASFPPWDGAFSPPSARSRVSFSFFYSVFIFFLKPPLLGFLCPFSTGHLDPNFHPDHRPRPRPRPRLPSLLLPSFHRRVVQRVHAQGHRARATQLSDPPPLRPPGLQGEESSQPPATPPPSPPSPPTVPRENFWRLRSPSPSVCVHIPSRSQTVRTTATAFTHDRPLSIRSLRHARRCLRLKRQAAFPAAWQPPTSAA